ncbi:MAG: hypothetical protein HC812_06670 [Leptolyngbya sp. RL_3_1]|nr:hypothetical protein [Leptolyngbya sp. RL_3_1]
MSASRLWNWVQLMGKQAQSELNAQLSAQALGTELTCEPIDARLAALPLAISADGVMVP